MEINSKKWVLTDDGCMQYCRKIGPEIYELIEMGECPEASKHSHYYHRATVNVAERLNDEEDVLAIIDDYGYDSIDDVKKLYGDDYGQILAECIFESEGPINGGGHDCKFFNSEAACIKAIKKVAGEG